MSVNIALWVLQLLLALHTAVGASWKLSNSEQGIPALKAMPRSVWRAMIPTELVCSVGLLLPAVYRQSAICAPITALIIAAEMLLFCFVHLRSGEAKHGSMIYWLVVAAVCLFIAYGRFVLSPLWPLSEAHIAVS